MIIEKLAQELGQKTEYVANVVALLDEGNTIPFIARYRKELHGSMDDTVLRNLETRLNYLRNLQERKDEVCRSIATQEKLTEELERCIPGSPEPSGLEGAEIGKLLNVFLSDAAEEDRFLFVRRYFEMKSIRERAKEYGASENLVKVRLHRLRKKLKRYLEKEGVEL